MGQRLKAMVKEKQVIRVGLTARDIHIIRVALGNYKEGDISGLDWERRKDLLYKFRELDRAP